MRVAIIGTGLIGGSIGLALKRSGIASRFVAFDLASPAAAAAVSRGAADEVAGSIGGACAGADLIFVATPVGAIARAVEQAPMVVADGAILTDVGSTKGRVVLEAERFLAARPGVAFI